MMNLRNTLKLAHGLLQDNNIEHALIGGLALACYGPARATSDIDLLIHEENKEKVKQLFKANALTLVHETAEVLQFSGLGFVDIILARRPLSQKILTQAHQNGPEGIRFIQAEDLIGLKIQAYINDPSRELQDKADIQFLIENVDTLDWDRIKTYANLFNQWESINEIKNKARL
jgi:hypothetical protein